MSHCLRQVSTLSRTPLQRSYDTLALASLRANMTVIGLMAAPKIHLKSVRSMQRNTPGLLDRRIGPKDMFIVLLYIVRENLIGKVCCPGSRTLLGICS
eukprot:Em0001g240a